ncbi:MAG: FliM/FliN family flagellar motor switch protein [Planctomycetota bacterium]|jgi:flagellar motor switch protein FliM
MSTAPDNDKSNGGKTSVQSRDLSRARIQQLLAVVGSEPAEDAAQTDASEYNWNEPHSFTREQLNKLDDFTKRMSKMISFKFSTLCPGDFSVKIDSVTQYFADKLLDEALNTEQNDYYLAFGTDANHPCGAIGIPTQTAFAWATQLLGDTETEKDTSRDLSQLEESLLSDVATTIVEALGGAHSAWDFQSAKAIVRRLVPLDLEGTEEVCKINFTVKKSDADETQAYFLILCDTLEPIVGKVSADAGRLSDEDISKAIQEQLEQIQVSVTAQLASTMFTLEEIMNLQIGDILLLEKEINESVELIVEGQSVLRGRPAKSAGRYAVVISENTKVTSGRSGPQEPSRTGA